MRKWLSCLSTLTLCGSGMTQGIIETKGIETVPANKPGKPGESKITPVKEQLTEAQKKLRELQMEFSQTQQKSMKEFQAAPPEERKKKITEIQATMNKLRSEYAQKAIDFALKIDEKDPGCPSAIQFAGQIDPKPEESLGKLAKDSQSKVIQGNAYLAIAQHFQRSTSNPGLTQEQKNEINNKAEELLEKVTKDYADVSNGRGTLGQVAKGALLQLKFLKIGKPVPEVSCLNIDGDKEDKLSNYKGKVVVLDIWTTWCGPCVAMIPHEREMVERLKGKSFALISVSGDDKKETLTKFLEKTKMPWIHWFDEQRNIIKGWNIQYFPTIYVIDHKGVIRAKDLRGEKLEAKVNELIAEMEKEKNG